jgi:hypothetical protein
MSLCLVLLLAAVGIDWWNGWKPFHQSVPDAVELIEVSTVDGIF